jgi:hypothetical protein
VAVEDRLHDVWRQQRQPEDLADIDFPIRSASAISVTEPQTPRHPTFLCHHHARANALTRVPLGLRHRRDRAGRRARRSACARRAEAMFSELLD